MDGRLPQGPDPPGPEPEPPPKPRSGTITTAVAAPAPRLGAPQCVRVCRRSDRLLKKRFNGIVETLLNKYSATPAEPASEPAEHTLGPLPAIASGPGVVSTPTGVETTPKKKKKKKKKNKTIHSATSIGVESADVSPSSSATIMTPSTPRTTGP